MLSELGDNIATRHPALINTAMNFVAHGQVLLDRQAPTEEIFQAATSDQISELGETIIKGLESEIWSRPKPWPPGTSAASSAQAWCSG